MIKGEYRVLIAGKEFACYVDKVELEQAARRIGIKPEVVYVKRDKPLAVTKDRFNSIVLEEREL